MYKAKFDSTVELVVVVAPQDVDLEEDDIDVFDVDVKIEGEEVHVKSERRKLARSHSGVYLTETIFTLLTNWGIDKKLFTITFDNATSNDTFVNLLKDGLKAIDEGIVKIRESIKYVKGSQARKKKFIDCVKYVNLNPKTGLRQDVPTRWNATYFMIESALFYRRAFFHLALSDSNYLGCPSHDERGKLEKIFRFLDVFYEVTCIFSGNKYFTTNLYFPFVSMVEKTLKEEMEMAFKMYEKFSKYWSEYSVILAMAAVLEPHYKIQYLELIYKKKLYGSESCDHIERVRERLFDLFKEYVLDSHVSCKTSTISRGDSRKVVHEKKSDTVLSKSTRDMLKLASMARDILSILVSTVAFESAFSNGGRVLNQYRSSLKHDIVEAIICTKDWLFGTKGDEELSLEELTDDVMQMDNNHIQVEDI
uniref:hAT-like transposase RNase-H fold domain-containing protein n=1 Tax=Lactuca sativa TaxID=4236 RepID=A0A9R1UPH6_LACSA|nr:hypothetical protein LSAT_V11C800401110 [Lactuca sativa]